MKRIKWLCLASFLFISIVLFMQRDLITLRPWLVEQPLVATGFATGNGERVAVIANSAETITVLDESGGMIYKIFAGNRAGSFVSVELLELDEKTIFMSTTRILAVLLRITLSAY